MVQFVFGQTRQGTVQDRIFHNVNVRRTQLNGCFCITCLRKTTLCRAVLMARGNRNFCLLNIVLSVFSGKQFPSLQSLSARFALASEADL